MGSVINTNMASLNAQRNLSTSATALTTSLQRLSSGLRINSAKDDAAGMAISSRMTAQINGLNQAARNANDGISLAQTAEGSLNAIGDNLQRLRDLSVQSSNASNSASDRASMNAEATQLVDEINRVASTSQFNGVNLLDGTFQRQAFQVGANAGQTISIASIASASASSLGVGSGSSYATNLNALTATTSTALTVGGLVLNGYSVGASAALDSVSSTEADSSAIAKAAAINAVSGQTGVNASVDATTLAVTAGAAGGATAAIQVNGVALGTAGVVTLSANATVAAGEMAAAINAVSNQTGVTATASGTAYTLTAADGRNINISATDAKAGTTAATTHASINLTSSSANGITIGGTLFAAIGGSIGNNAATATVGAGVSSIDLTTSAGASAALSIIDSALSQVNTSRGALGAIQNRFASAVSNLMVTSENLTASRSRIQDADFAAETAAMTRGQILQQAGTAILAQANSLPNSVLSLLK
jgi:flagellin